MANSPSAKKRARQAVGRREHNTAFRSKARTEIKRVVNAIQGGDKEAAEKAFKSAVPAIDSVASKGIIHPNKAARHKKRLNAQIKQLSA